ncbi:tail fiber assembly protein [Providencia sp. PROV036]|uniref:tail fiber assembly protein n=1 Tax=Providencia sp. PROV036 TaxID=2949767 RepID=UPI00234AC810|nr:tail fiber assembly protein [Providencia sp. PROV036]
MKYYYSAKANSFYPESLKWQYEHSGSFPDDAIMVSESVWLKYAGFQCPIGMVRVAGKDGMPKWAPIPEKTNEDHTKEAEQQKEKILSEIINETQIWQTQLSLKIINDSDKSKLKEWMMYAQKIQSIDASKAPDIVWPEPPKK